MYFFKFGSGKEKKQHNLMNSQFVNEWIFIYINEKMHIYHIDDDGNEMRKKEVLFNIIYKP